MITRLASLGTVQNFSHYSFFQTIFLILFLAGTPVNGDNRPGGADAQHPLEEELAVFNGRVIDSIEIENREIFDTKDEAFDNFIFRTANKLHIKTQKSIIYRELLLNKGEEFDAELAEESVRNLRNRYIIFDAWNEVTLLSDSTILWRIVTIDEWSFAGGFEVSREGNEYIYEIGFEEKNFLGLNQLLSLDYVIQEKDDNYFKSSFRDYRLFGKPVSFAASYSDNPRSDVKALSVSRPFYNLSQKNSFGFHLALASTRNEVFSNSRLIGSSRSVSDIYGTSLSYRFGDRVKNLVSTLFYDYNYERTGDKIIHSAVAADSSLSFSSFPKDSLYHQLGLGFRIFKVDFVTFRKIDGFGFTEDFTLGHTAAIGYSRAFNPDFDDHVY
ncbi:MAG: hypothetical protein ACREBV_05240, partial [Candidatus Zixiibacteriota bacterium]